ncbi:MAG: coproporphyrinogen III oxidase family protein [Spirochaetaceae bacterium]|jgi:oxygen-independent coproporphyrinogen-3 oxidase|nr:coproporphyrinogen III oxidase family protein [Spirochaetaceae bacterium]
MTASLYIHIPFCVSKCAYCDFYSQAVSPRDPAVSRYRETLLAEIAAKITAYRVNEIPTIYVGGGTPSLLGAKGITRLLSFVTAGPIGARLAPNAEITVEANPDTMDEAFLAACKEHGATRVSVGVETFHDECRKRVGRPGNGLMVKKKLALLNKMFPGAFSADLMSGLPGQDEAVLKEDIKTLLAYRPAHISLYDLIPHGNFPGKFRGLLPDDQRAALWIKGRDILLEAGYEQYEVSNFALTVGARSAHNIRYWRMQNWIGVGKTASGTIIDDEKGEGFRETDGCIEPLDSDTLIKETFLMGFRFCEGPDRELFKRRFHRTIEETIPASLAKGEERGVIRKGTTKPEPRGLLFLDSFLRDCFAEIASKK